MKAPLSQFRKMERKFWPMALSSRLSPLEAALATLTVYHLWQRFALPGMPAQSCSSPFRVDRNPSFWISECGRKWRDHGAAEGGGLVEFVLKARGGDRSTAAKLLIALAGTGRASAETEALLRQLPQVSPTICSGPAVAKQLTPRPPIKWPETMRPGTDEELRVLAHQRGFPGTAGLKAATKEGRLWFAGIDDWFASGSPDNGVVCRLAWILTDSFRQVALARRADGREWNRIQAKAWLLGGSAGRWPIGAPEIGARAAVGLVEGGPDLLALYHLLITRGGGGVAPVAVPSGCAIHEAALVFFRGKHVTLYPHNDGGSGAKAQAAWTQQLRAAGAASVSVFSFSNFVNVRSGRSPKDLNEWLTSDSAGQLSPTPAAAGCSPRLQATGIVPAQTT